MARWERWVASLASLAALWSPAPPWAAGPTDIVRVDDYIGAPRTLFGRTRRRDRAGARPAAPGRGRARWRATAIPPSSAPPGDCPITGLVIDLLDTGRVRRVRIEAPGRGLPFGLDVGTSRADVERILGEPQEAEDSHLMYLYSDGYPDTVHFHLRNGRVREIEWNFGSAE